MQPVVSEPTNAAITTELVYAVCNKVNYGDNIICQAENDSGRYETIYRTAHIISIFTDNNNNN